MLETWLEALGATITGSIHDAHDVGGGEWGYATIGDLRLRYSWESIHIGWEPEFDRWANSLDWIADIPDTQEDLEWVIAEATRLGGLGDADERLGAPPAKITPPRGHAQ